MTYERESHFERILINTRLKGNGEEKQQRLVTSVEIKSARNRFDVTVPNENDNQAIPKPSAGGELTPNGQK